MLCKLLSTKTIMDILPAELHSHICSLACTDDGYTARSLSLLSRYFFQTSLPFRYLSICITKTPQIQSLSERLQATPSHLRRIQRLFISDDGCDSQALVNFMDILMLAAPTLETLALITTSSFTSASLIARIFRACFPHLHELTISGHYPFPSTPSCFPSLERLHLLGNRNPYGLLSLGGLESVMPNLTYLRVSGLTLAVSFSQELEQAFASSTTDEEDRMFPAKLPPKLEHLSIQCGPESSFTSPSLNVRLKDENMIQNLEKLEERVKKEGHATKFSLLARSTRKLTVDDLHKQWVDRLRSKAGCWSSM